MLNIIQESTEKYDCKEERVFSFFCKKAFTTILTGGFLEINFITQGYEEIVQ